MGRFFCLKRPDKQRERDIEKSLHFGAAPTAQGETFKSKMNSAAFSGNKSPQSDLIVVVRI